MILGIHGGDSGELAPASSSRAESTRRRWRRPRRGAARASGFAARSRPAAGGPASQGHRAEAQRTRWLWTRWHCNIIPVVRNRRGHASSARCVRWHAHLPCDSDCCCYCLIRSYPLTARCQRVGAEAASGRVHLEARRGRQRRGVEARTPSRSRVEAGTRARPAG
jgi:hypothetical protein